VPKAWRWAGSKGRGNLRCSHSVDSRKLEFSGSFSMGVVMPWPLMFLAIN